MYYEGIRNARTGKFVIHRILRTKVRNKAKISAKNGTYNSPGIPRLLRTQIPSKWQAILI